MQAGNFLACKFLCFLSGDSIMGKRKKEELPDYTVANMDVDGMP